MALKQSFARRYALRLVSREGWRGVGVRSARLPWGRVKPAAATLAPPGARAFQYFYPRLRGGLWRKSGRLRPKMTAATLAVCRVHPASLSLRRPNSFANCLASLGRFRGGRRCMT